MCLSCSCVTDNGEEEKGGESRNDIVSRGKEYYIEKDHPVYADLTL